MDIKYDKLIRYLREIKAIYEEYETVDNHKAIVHYISNFQQIHYYFNSNYEYCGCHNEVL